MSDYFNKNQDNDFDNEQVVKDIMKDNGGKEFFRELNAARVPFFFAAAVKNTADGTEYLCEAITPNSQGITLTDDKFADFLNIRNHGFVTIPSFDAASPSAQALQLFQDSEGGQDKPFYSQEILAKFGREQMAVIDDGEEFEDGDWIPEQPATHGGVRTEGEPAKEADAEPCGQDAQKVMEAVMWSVVTEDGTENYPADEKPGQAKAATPGSETLDIIWGGSHLQPKDYRDEFSQIDERHQGILKGNGSFMERKGRESASYGLSQDPDLGSTKETESGAEKPKTENENQNI